MMHSTTVDHYAECDDCLADLEINFEEVNESYKKVMALIETNLIKRLNKVSSNTPGKNYTLNYVSGQQFYDYDSPVELWSAVNKFISDHPRNTFLAVNTGYDEESSYCGTVFFEHSTEE